MNNYKIAVLAVRAISVYSFLQLFKNADNIIRFYFRQYENPELHGDLLGRSIVASFGPLACYLIMSILLWVFAGKIASLISPDKEQDRETDYVAVFQIGIALVGLYLIVWDISGIFWAIGDYFGEQTGRIHNEGSSEALSDLAINLLNFLVSLFLIVKAGWISRKLHQLWNKK